MVLWYIKNIKIQLARVKYWLSRTTVIPVVFVIGASFFNLIFLSRTNQSNFVLGGPALAQSILIEDEDSFLNFPISENDEDFGGFVVLDSAAVLNANSPLSNLLPTRDGLLVYKIQAGDTLSKIAANFGISLNTILLANPDLRANLIRPGQEIVVLPISGVLHQVQEDETPESIASLYGVDVSQILKYNRNLSAATFVIPGAKVKKTTVAISTSQLPDLRGYFILPTTGWNWGRLHPTNAVDIANACGTPIYAAAEGLIISAPSYGWNDGYGHYVDIEHPNGVLTRYAHTSQNAVSAGDYVSQGDLIAYIGNTGNTHGPTGCHLHFEIRGARNPFVK
ncbi:MAG: hypothetical protein A3I24_01690 [Candidatus Harrisonbacteria bacterium RIFCSPLOWO2_02_FULL_41_13b]|uniref:LysM domain-containing protein n=1 Tax=Candidatus Harrisonbacteria bacterium RIFCSPLOWO2_02_FULL_41_13b TaxID=1798409 RepID=A0A1G1ZWR9_9BACT|nr:MAG: hypothetical protein A3J53_01110 [Candidatus Harrisonbacteria bacterium RIFCSPHIGHO2_02_FULL_40_20]OGY68317.1 MAG: hypothetical protein A3I24_01690 [Candidatus Harrisonbacteria bacterium RIFCSPLOWO2_02_FULL_41_13b]